MMCGYLIGSRRSLQVQQSVYGQRLAANRLNAIAPPHHRHPKTDGGASIRCVNCAGDRRRDNRQRAPETGQAGSDGRHRQASGRATPAGVRTGHRKPHSAPPA